MLQKFKMLWAFMKGKRLLYLGAILSIALATLFSYVAPLVIRVSIDSIIGGKPLDAPTIVEQFIEKVGGVVYLRNNLWIAGLILLIMTLFEGVFTYIKGRWSAMSAEGTAKQLRESLYDHLQRLPFSYHSKSYCIKILFQRYNMI